MFLHPSISLLAPRKDSDGRYEFLKPGNSFGDNDNWGIFTTHSRGVMNFYPVPHETGRYRTAVEPNIFSLGDLDWYEFDDEIEFLPKNAMAPHALISWELPFFTGKRSL